MSGYRQPYTQEEDKKIVKYIREKEAYHLLRGYNLYRDISREVLPHRTFQSLHQRFRKSIIPHISNPAYNLSKDEQNKFRRTYEELAKPSRRDNAEPLDIETGHNNSEHVIEVTESDDANHVNGEEKRGEPQCSRMAGFRQPYSREEEIKMVNYIKEKKSYHLLRGYNLYKDMSRDILPHRTFQSLHQRFRKFIIPHIRNPAYNLSTQEQNKFRKTYDEAARPSARRTDTDSTNNETDQNERKVPNFFEMNDSNDDSSGSDHNSTNHSHNSEEEEEDTDSSSSEDFLAPHGRVRQDGRENRIGDYVDLTIDTEMGQPSCSRDS